MEGLRMEEGEEITGDICWYREHYNHYKFRLLTAVGFDIISDFLLICCRLQNNYAKTNINKGGMEIRLGLVW
jgi:hypothetical protein